MRREVGLAEGPESMEDWSSSSKPWSYVLLSLSYFMFIVVILGAVISGIIIGQRQPNPPNRMPWKTTGLNSGVTALGRCVWGNAGR